MVGFLLNKELERMWKEAIWVNLRYYPTIGSRGSAVGIATGYGLDDRRVGV
jgi:hypothetical protein